LGHRKLQVLN